MASVYQSAINCTKDRTGTGMGVRWRAAMTMPTRNVMARKRTRPSHDSHSLTLGVDFISDFSPRYRREQRYVHVVPKSCRAADTCQRMRRRLAVFRERSAWMRASAARVLVACQFADQREQRQVHGNNDAADD